MATPTSEIKPRSGMKGKAVRIIHVYEDYLWAMGDKSEPPEMHDVSDDEYVEEEEVDETNAENNSTKEPSEVETKAVEESEDKATVVHLSTNGKVNLTGRD